VSLTTLALCLCSSAAYAQSQWFKPQTNVFSDGTQMLVDTTPAGLAAVRIIVFGGAVHEANQWRGLADVTGRVLVHPVATTTVPDAIHDLQRRLHRIGATLKVQTGLVSTVFALDAPSESIIEALELILANLSSPSISKSRIKTEATIRSQSIFTASGEELHSCLSTMLYEMEGQRLLDPTLTSSQSIDADAVLHFYRKYYRPDRLMILAAGRVRASDLSQAINRHMLLPMPDDKSIFITATSTSVLAMPALPMKTTGLASSRRRFEEGFLFKY
jgi:predicted Zn-dependent peptidase